MDKIWAVLKEKSKINWKFLPLNSMIFFFYGGIHCFLLYLNIHLKSLGFSNLEITIINSFLPIIAIIAPLITGLLVDKLGRTKLVTAIFIILCGISYGSILVIPHSNYSEMRFGKNGFMINFTNKKNFTLHLLPENISISNNSLIDDGCHLMTIFKIYKEKSSNSDSLANENNLFNISASCNTSFYEEIYSLSAEKKMNYCYYHIDDFSYIQNICKSISKCELNSLSDLSLTCVDLKNNFSEINQFNDRPKISDIKFISAFIIRGAAMFIMSSIHPLLDSVIWATFKKHGEGYYGHTRMWMNAAQIVFPFLSGLVLDTAASYYEQTKFWPAYVMAEGVFILAAIILMNISLDEEKIEGRLLKNLKEIIKLKHFALYAVAFIFGMTPGFVFVFIPIFLRTELKSPMTVIGLMPTVAGVSGIIVLLFSDFLVKKLGHFNVLAVGFCASGIRLFLYSVIMDPWLIIPIEVLKAISQYLSIVAFITFGKLVTSPGLVTTMMALIRILIYGCGRSAGVALGGALIEFWQERPTFQILCVGHVIMMILCIGIQCLHGQPNTSNTTMVNKKNEPENIESNQEGVSK